LSLLVLLPGEWTTREVLLLAAVVLAFAAVTRFAPAPWSTAAAGLGGTVAAGAAAVTVLLPAGLARSMLWAVAGFGVATIVFGLSKSFWLSFAMLAVTGALDNVSVVVRHTLVQALPPDSVRGRVAAVNGVFIGASNDLGGYLSPYLRRGAVVRCGPSTYVIGTVPAKKAAQLSAAIRPCADAPGGQAS